MKQRGDIWWINFDPSVGQEIKKKRPAIIVSNNMSNKYLKRFQVIPVSSNVEKIYPSETTIQIEGNTGKVMADQLTTVSELRLVSKIGNVTEKELEEIESIIKLQLDLD